MESCQKGVGRRVLPTSTEICGAGEEHGHRDGWLGAGVEGLASGGTNLETSAFENTMSAEAASAAWELQGQEGA